MILDNPIGKWVRDCFHTNIRGRTLKQIFCKHHFKKYAVGRSTNQDVLKCNICGCYRVRHVGIMLQYDCGTFNEDFYNIIGGKNERVE